MPADSPPASLIGRLHIALDRLEIALERAEARLEEADAAREVLIAMTEDRARLAADVDDARREAKAASAAAVRAEAQLAAAAGAVKDVLDEGAAKPRRRGGRSRKTKEPEAVPASEPEADLPVTDDARP